MEVMENIFSQPIRRDLLRLGIGCAAAGVLCRAIGMDSPAAAFKALQAAGVALGPTIRLGK